MDQQARAGGRAKHIGLDHGIALDPFEARATEDPPSSLRISVSRVNAPSALQKAFANRAAERTRSADHQRRRCVFAARQGCAPWLGAKMRRSRAKHNCRM